jgi:hypothetical protein
VISPTLRDSPSIDLFPHRKTCEWVEQAAGLSARTCDDGSVTMWRDEDGNTWAPNEKPPARWRQSRAAGLGDSAPAGICPPHPSYKPHPLAKIRRLQNALRGLAGRVGEPALRVTADGLLGTHTVAMTNHAMVRYVGASAADLATGSLSRAQISAFAAQLAAFIEKAPQIPAGAPPMPQPQAQYQPGAPTMPQYDDDPGYYQQPQQAVYYPPSYDRGPRRAPGGLPADHASLDVKAFVPAQYEHIRMEPGTAMLLIAGGVIVFLLLNNKKKAA